jgi:hypothetical protein
MEWWGNSNFGSLLLYPAYVQDYLDRVTAADVAAGNTQGLERGVTDAFNQTLQDLVADTILGVSGGVIEQAASLSKAMPFMCGARTIAGCLTPVVGPAPTNFNFTGSNYNRKTGLVGDGATTYLSSNRANNADPANKHLSIYKSSNPSVSGGLIGVNAAVNGASWIFEVSLGGGNDTYRVNTSPSVTLATPAYPDAGFIGVQRISSSSSQRRYSGATITDSSTSQTPSSLTIDVFRAGPNNYTNARISHYSIGEVLNLALLDARITGLMNTLAGLTL